MAGPTFYETSAGKTSAPLWGRIPFYYFNNVALVFRQKLHNITIRWTIVHAIEIRRDADASLRYAHLTRYRSVRSAMHIGANISNCSAVSFSSTLTPFAVSFITI